VFDAAVQKQIGGQLPDSEIADGVVGRKSEPLEDTSQGLLVASQQEGRYENGDIANEQPFDALREIAG
jgi:hypothetical protein